MYAYSCAVLTHTHTHTHIHADTHIHAHTHAHTAHTHTRTCTPNITYSYTTCIYINKHDRFHTRCIITYMSFSESPHNIQTATTVSSNYTTIKIIWCQMPMSCSDTLKTGMIGISLQINPETTGCRPVLCNNQLHS